MSCTAFEFVPPLVWFKLFGWVRYGINHGKTKWQRTYQFQHVRFFRENKLLESLTACIGKSTGNASVKYRKHIRRYSRALEREIKFTSLRGLSGVINASKIPALGKAFTSRPGFTTNFPAYWIRWLMIWMRYDDGNGYQEYCVAPLGARDFFYICLCTFTVLPFS